MRTIVTEFEKVIEELKKQNRLDKKALIEPNFYLSYEKLYKNILILARMEARYLVGQLLTVNVFILKKMATKFEMIHTR